MKAWRQHRCGSAIRIEQALDQDLPNSSRSLAIFTAITEGTSLLMCPYGYFRASIIRFAIACCSSGGRSLIASVNLSGSPSARRREPARITMKAAQSCEMKNRRAIQTTKTTPNVIGQLKPKLRISPATATAMTKLTNQAIPRQGIGMWTPLECGLALPAV